MKCKLKIKLDDNSEFKVGWAFEDRVKWPSRELGNVNE